MTKKRKQELVDMLYDLTLHSADQWMIINKKTSIDKQMFAFLHIGFVQGLMMEGVSEKDAASIPEEVVKLLK